MDRGEFHGQRSLAGYSPWCHQESGKQQQTFQDCVALVKGMRRMLKITQQQSK